MTFEEFWKQNRDRYLKLAEKNVKLAINCAAEEAWDVSMLIADEISDKSIKDFLKSFKHSTITTEKEQEINNQPPFARG